MGGQGTGTTVAELFSPGEVAALPDDVLRRACELYDEVRGQPGKVGDSDVVDGHWIETHTLGCRREGGDPEDSLWDCHYEFYDRYAADGVSAVGGDPSDGVFVTVTPQLAPGARP